MRFEPVVLRPDEEELRAEVRGFLAEELPRGSYRPGLGMSAVHSAGFTRKLAQRGWVGMAIPPEYGGHGRTPVDRFIVAEELLAAGAPVAAHWTADRQTAPTVMAFGTEAQRRRFLPAIARGECFFSIGMSEPDAGSDLASVRTVATPVEGGFVLNGTKIWTSGAHLNHFFCVLCRTSPPGEDRHQGLSQLIVSLSADGVEVKPIPFLDGSHHFNQVMLQDVFVPHDMVLGEVGMGWQQVTSELSYERSGPDRFLSTYQLLETYLAERAGKARPKAPSGGVAPSGSPRSPHGEASLSPAAPEALGRLAARYWTIRQLSLSVARALERGMAPAVESAMVKDLGTTFEQEVVAVLQGLLDYDPDPGSPSLFESLLAQATLVAPSYTIRGGTTEVLRGVVARSLRRGR